MNLKFIALLSALVFASVGIVGVAHAQLSFTDEQANTTRTTLIYR